MLSAERLAERAAVVEALRSSSRSGRLAPPGKIAEKVTGLILADLAVIGDDGDPWRAAAARREVIDEWLALIFGVPVSDADEGHAAEAEVVSKVCTRCGRPRPLSDFAIRNGVADGRVSTCKPCLRPENRKRNAQSRAAARIAAASESDLSASELGTIEPRCMPSPASARSGATRGPARWSRLGSRQLVL